MAGLNSDDLRQVQLALASTLASPGLFDALRAHDRERTSLAPDQPLTRFLADNGLPLAPGTTIPSVATDPEGKVSLTICVDFGSSAHCTIVTIQSPITFS